MRERSATLACAVARCAATLALVVAAACGNGLRPRDGGSAADASIESQVRWVWAGALEPTAIVVKARLAGPTSGPVRLAVSEDPQLERAERFDGEPATGDPTVFRFDVAGLRPNQDHFYALEIDGELARGRSGRFTTPPVGPFSFTVALGACAETGSNHAVFDEIREARPFFFLHMGDFHYENISSRDPEPYRRAYDRVLASPRQSALFRSAPIVYVWDDHDFAGNNSDGHARGRAAARAVYREVVPHYPLPAGAGDAPIHQSFVIGRVLFVVTDSRSARSPRGQADGPDKTMLGALQKTWLLRQLADAGRHGLVVWVNTLPWIAPVDSGADDWGGYATERREIAQFVTAEGIRNLIMVSGDAHMLAIDDGSNNTFDGAGGPGFPVLHAASLDRRGSMKGGPYSEGTYPGNGRYALMHIEDDGGDRIRVRWSGRAYGEGELVGLDIEVEVPPAAAVATEAAATRSAAR